MKTQDTTLLAIAVVVVWSSLGAQAQFWRPPAEGERCPSKWGADDQRGSGNHMKPETVLRAVKLIRTGEVFELGQVLGPGMALYGAPGARRFDLVMKRTTYTPKGNNRGSNEELVTTELGQVGTQFDGFAHQTLGNIAYNCFKVDEIATRTGFTKLGIENVGALVTRGVLIDIAALKGVSKLPDTYEITPQDLQDALKKQGLTLQPGDAIIINTGWGQLWGKENTRYARSSPGIGVAAGEWLAKQDPMLIGSDNATVGQVNPDDEISTNVAIHPMMLAVYGIHLLESLKLEDLVARRVHEFAFILQPLKIQGATGSTVAPIAIR